ncbi:MAG: tRNA uridine 5-oxyacetic acid(34) methyltransferase CmoM [Candidatus Rifleibacteriota bacterium]
MSTRQKNSGDISFDGISQSFYNKIYKSGKGRIRLEVLKHDMLQGIPELSTRIPLRILDAGGGIGQIARWLASMGHQVILADVSQEMLAKAQELNAAEKLDNRIRILKTAIQDLPSVLKDAKFDLILLHGVIAWMEKPLSAIELLMPMLDDHGKISLLFYNRDKLIMKWGICGSISKALNGRSEKQSGLTPINPVGYAEVAQVCRHLGLKILSKAGIRIFYKFLKNFPDHNEITEDFVQLEKKYCRIEPFASLGEHIHLVLQKI